MDSVFPDTRCWPEPVHLLISEPERTERRASWISLLLLRCHGLRGLPLDMSRIHPECPDTDPCDRSAAAEFVLRQELDEEDEEEDEGDGKEDNDDDDNDDDGYSE